jgi:hypothetical protein
MPQRKDRHFAFHMILYRTFVLINSFSFLFYYRIVAILNCICHNILKSACIAKSGWS